MYRFEQTNHDILQNFLFQNLNKLFLHARNLHQYYPPSLSDYKNHPYIHKDKQLFLVRKFICIKKLFL